MPNGNIKITYISDDGHIDTLLDQTVEISVSELQTIIAIIRAFLGL